MERAFSVFQTQGEGVSVCVKACEPNSKRNGLRWTSRGHDSLRSVTAGIGIIYAAWLALWVRGSTADPEMKKIQAAIHEGASAYMARQYKTVA